MEKSGEEHGTLAMQWTKMLKRGEYRNVILGAIGNLDQTEAKEVSWVHQMEYGAVHRVGVLKKSFM